MKTETAKHTPGPWSFKAISPDIAHKSIVGPLNETGTSRNILAEVHMIHPNHDADGYLMAAAPELLSALELIARHLGDLANLASMHNEDTVYLQECAGLQNLADEAIRKARNL